MCHLRDSSWAGVSSRYQMSDGIEQTISCYFCSLIPPLVSHSSKTLCQCLAASKGWAFDKGSDPVLFYFILLAQCYQLLLAVLTHMNSVVTWILSLLPGVWRYFLSLFILGKGLALRALASFGGNKLGMLPCLWCWCRGGAEQSLFWCWIPCCQFSQCCAMMFYSLCLLHVSFVKSVITLAEFDVIIKELHKSLLGSEQFLAKVKQILGNKFL